MALPLFAGSFVALLGALFLVLITHLTGREFGLIVWAIGAGVGGAALFASDRSRSTARGVACVLITLVGVFVGMFTTLTIAEEQYADYHNTMLRQALEADEEYVVAWLAADENVADPQRWEQVNWPAPDVDGYRNAAVHYPPELWAVASDRWNAKDDDARQHYRDELFERLGEHRPAWRIAAQSFSYSIGVLDVIWIVLAASSAYAIAVAGRDERQADDQSTPGEHDPPGPFAR